MTTPTATRSRKKPAPVDEPDLVQTVSPAAGVGVLGELVSVPLASISPRPGSPG